MDSCFRRNDSKNNMNKQRVLVLIKPDGVKRGLIGKVLRRFETVGLKIIGFKFIWAEKKQIIAHYPSSEAWLKKVGERTLVNYQRKGLDAEKLLGTKDAVEIGRLVKGWLVKYLQESPVLSAVLEGYEAIAIVRKLCGDTTPLFAAPGTIRGDFSMDNIDLANEKGRPMKNIIHASDNPDDAQKEVKIWFKEEELFEYERVDEKIMFE